MTIVSICSIKGAPGVTTLACLIGATWPVHRCVLVAEADVSGGDLAARFSLSSRRGWTTLSASIRRERRGVFDCGAPATAPRRSGSPHRCPTGGCPCRHRSRRDRAAIRRDGRGRSVGRPRRPRSCRYRETDTGSMAGAFGRRGGRDASRCSIGAATPGAVVGARRSLFGTRRVGRDRRWRARGSPTVGVHRHPTHL